MKENTEQTVQPTTESGNSAKLPVMRSAAWDEDDYSDEANVCPNCGREFYDDVPFELAQCDNCGYPNEDDFIE